MHFSRTVERTQVKCHTHVVVVDLRLSYHKGGLATCREAGEIVSTRAAVTTVRAKLVCACESQWWVQWEFTALTSQVQIA